MNGGRKYHTSIYIQKDVTCLGIQLSKQVSFAITLQKSQYIMLYDPIKDTVERHYSLKNCRGCSNHKQRRTADKRKVDGLETLYSYIMRTQRWLVTEA